MTKCSTCGKTMFGGIKVGDLRYCSEKCAAHTGFLPRFEAALSRAIAANPRPIPEATADPREVDSGMDPSRPGPDFEADDPIDAGKDLMILLVGSAFALSVGAAIYWLVGLVQYPFHAQTFWFVIPIGAYLCGMVAGGGFLSSLRSMNRLPTGMTFVTAGLVGIASYFLIYGLMWWFLEVRGVRARDEIGFLDFLRVVLENQRVKVGRGAAAGEGFELGKWGYPRFAINLLGFAAGVISMVGLAGGKGYCPRCKLYLKSAGKQTRTSSDPEATAEAIHPVIVAMVDGRLQEAVDRHAASGEPGNKQHWTSTIQLEACPGCGLHRGTLTATLPGEQGPAPVPGFSFQGTCPKPVRLPDDAAMG